MTTDHHFWIGTTHKVCEDYAISGIRDGVKYAIVCDGCSSSKDTDIGARLLARAALLHLDRFENSDEFGLLAITTADVQARALALNPGALNATLVVTIIKDNKWITRLFGDGAVAQIYEKKTFVTEVNFNSGAPLYLSYHLDKDTHLNYLTEFGTKHSHTTYDITELDIAPRVVEGDNELNLLTYGPIIDHPDVGRVLATIVMSDGFQSFYRVEQTDTSKRTITIPSTKIYQELLMFKGYKGQFVERRAKKFMTAIQKKGWHNGDDCSIAAIHVGE
jgi:hypothetical protein